jgi:glycolate oxidase FAD binding subunit
VTVRAATKRLFERLRDETVPAGAEFVVAPGSLEEARDAIVVAADAGMTVGFWGGGTHRGIGNPVEADVMITTSRLDRVVDWQPEDLTVVVEPGVSVAALGAILSERGQTAVLPEDPGDTTVGGVVAAGVSAFRRLRFGPTRDRVLEVHLVTGYGEIVRAGGSVVKNSTGYDLSRLATGSLGSLGFIGRIRLKIWADPIASATVAVPDVESARLSVYRPLAALEQDGRGAVYLVGTEDEIAAQADLLEGTVDEGLLWPDPIEAPIRFAMRIPPRFVAAAVEELGTMGGRRYVASFGVGEVIVGMQESDVAVLGRLRSWSENLGGSLVLLDAPPDVSANFGAWGTVPSSAAMQRRVKDAFDPAGICNPGILPGGI